MGALPPDSLPPGVCCVFLRAAPALCPRLNFLLITKPNLPCRGSSALVLEDDATPTPDSGEVISPEPVGNDPGSLAAEAERLYLEAQDLLKAGDLGGYQTKLDQVGELLIQLSDELGN